MRALAFAGNKEADISKLPGRVVPKPRTEFRVVGLDVASLRSIPGQRQLNNFGFRRLAQSRSNCSNRTKVIAKRMHTFQSRPVFATAIL
jgi:hypothetical protein